MKATAEHIRNLNNKISELEKQVEYFSGIAHKVPTLFNAIKHGSEDHKRWLHDAITAHFIGFKIPEYRE